MINIEAVEKTSQESLDEGEYGRKGWFTAWDVRKHVGKTVHVEDLRQLVTKGLLEEGSREDSISVGTSAFVFRLPPDLT